MVSVIADALAELLPDQADLYEANASDIIAEIEEIDDWIIEQAATVPADNRKLVTTHDSFQYYAAAYGFEVAGALEGLSTESQLSASQLSRLVDLIKEAEVPAVFAEATTNPRLISNVASSAEVEVADKVLYADGPVGPDSDAPTYQTMLVTNTCTIVTALGGSCDADSAPLR
jgi:manganese/iron transport system substrate-binding protein